MRLFLLISSCCVVWGVCIGSFFGIQLKPTSPLQKASVLQMLVTKKAEYHIRMQDDVYHEWLGKDPSIANKKTPLEFLTTIEKRQGGSV